MRLIDLSLLRRTLRTGANLLTDVLHLQALTLTELGKLAESLAELLGGRGSAQSPSQTTGGPAPMAQQSLPEDEGGGGAAPPPWPAGPEPAGRAPARERHVAGRTSATQAGTPLGGQAGGGTAAAIQPVAHARTPPVPPAFPTEPATDQKRRTREAKLAAAPAGPSSAVPAHVDEEAVLVAESADQGAEEDAGAAVHVEEPWNGYRLMRAREIVDRLPAVADEVLALVLLYEPRGGRRRSSIIRAAERELARRSA